ncbi:hypothetical protein V8C26DRAFT_222771 [Trichoderma gracile]
MPHDEVTEKRRRWKSRYLHSKVSQAAAKAAKAGAHRQIGSKSKLELNGSIGLMLDNVSMEIEPLLWPNPLRAEGQFCASVYMYDLTGELAGTWLASCRACWAGYLSRVGTRQRLLKLKQMQNMTSNALKRSYIMHQSSDSDAGAASRFTTAAPTVTAVGYFGRFSTRIHCTLRFMRATSRQLGVVLAIKQATSTDNWLHSSIHPPRLPCSCLALSLICRQTSLLNLQPRLNPSLQENESLREEDGKDKEKGDNSKHDFLLNSIDVWFIMQLFKPPLDRVPCLPASP